jgi:signal transduction histidine kinase
MRRSIQTKITFYNILIIVFAFLIFTLITQQITTRYLNDRLREDLIEEAKFIMTTLMISVEEGSNEESYPIDRLRTSTSKLSRFRLNSQVNILSVLPNRSSLLGESDGLIKEDMINIVSTDKKAVKPFDYTALGGTEHIVIYSKIPTEGGGRIANSYMIISVDKGSIQSFTQQIRRSQLLLTLILALIAAVVSSSYARTLTKPLRQLNSAAKHISKRDYPAPLNISTGDEIEELTDSINAMSDSLMASDEKQWRFFQNASHELKTPLMSIQGYTEGMIDGIFEKDTEHLTIITQEVKRLSNIVNNIAYLSRIDAISDGLDLESLPIDAIVEDSVEKLKGLYSSSSIDIQLNLASHATMQLDKDQITQALINILSNGLRYAKSLIIVDLEETPQEIIITIFDDGEGIPEEQIPLVFERFQKGEKGQSGLGLAITRSIIEKHSGYIIASNKDHAGGCFAIHLPLNSSQQQNS